MFEGLVVTHMLFVEVLVHEEIGEGVVDCSIAVELCSWWLVVIFYVGIFVFVMYGVILCIFWIV